MISEKKKKKPVWSSTKMKTFSAPLRNKSASRGISDIKLYLESSYDILEENFDRKLF